LFKKEDTEHPRRYSNKAYLEQGSIYEIYRKQRGMKWNNKKQSLLFAAHQANVLAILSIVLIIAVIKIEIHNLNLFLKKPFFILKTQ